MTEGIPQWLYSASMTEMLRAAKEKEMCKNMITNVARCDDDEKVENIKKAVEINLEDSLQSKPRENSPPIHTCNLHIKKFSHPPIRIMGLFSIFDRFVMPRE